MPGARDLGLHRLLDAVSLFTCSQLRGNVYLTSQSIMYLGLALWPAREQKPDLLLVLLLIWQSTMLAQQQLQGLPIILCSMACGRLCRTFVRSLFTCMEGMLTHWPHRPVDPSAVSVTYRQ